MIYRATHAERERGSMDRSPLAGAREDSGTEATEAELKFIRDHGSDLMSDAEYSVHFDNCIKHIRSCE